MTALFPGEQRDFARTVSSLEYANPFLPERIDFERRALGDAFREVGPTWSKQPAALGQSPNVERIVARTERLVEETRRQIEESDQAPSEEDRVLYEDIVLFLLFHRYQGFFHDMIRGALRNVSPSGRAVFFRDFESDMQRLLYAPFRAGASESRGATTEPLDETPAVQSPLATAPRRGEIRDPETGPPHVFACFFQIRRAFHHVFENILGGSMPASRLRAAVWQSIFSHDLRRYRRVLYDRMADVTCLIAGPSGTGKELVARAIGLSRYIPFDRGTERFAEDFMGSFSALNISALSPTLIESELFGHRKGAFTGAIQDRVGWFEACPPLGTVFLDEIGEIDTAIQVKLLRVLETRSFQRIGDIAERRFEGKLIAATNRDLACEIRDGGFREDLYYRLCSDMIRTPTLHERLRSDPAELQTLVRYIAGRLTDAEDAERLAAEVDDWIAENLGEAYAWPGNFRELEQCLRNIMIRSSYQPLCVQAGDPADAIAEAMRQGSLTADELLVRYCTLTYARTGNYQETARRLNLDHRTVKSRIDPELLKTYRGESDAGEPSDDHDKT